MRIAAATVGLSAIVAQALLFVVLSGCDELDVTSSAEPPSARCASCHLPEFRAATHPPHEGVKPTTCGTCHSQASFHPSRLEHSFPLDGAHASERARADAAVARHASFGDACGTCHGTSAWRPTLHEEPSATSRTPAAAPTASSPAEPARTPQRRRSVEPPAEPSAPVRAPQPAVTARGGTRRTPDSVSGASPAHGR